MPLGTAERDETMKFFTRGLTATLCLGLLTCFAPRAATSASHATMSGHRMAKCSSGDRIVMVNTKTKTYYVHTNRMMRMSQSYMHMCEKRAKAAGYRMSGSRHRPMHRAAKPQMNAPLPSASPTIQTNPENEKNGVQTTPTPNPQPTR